MSNPVLAIVAAAILASLAFVALKVHDDRIQAETAQKIYSKSKEVGKKNAAKSEAAHKAAERPGAAERLRRDQATCPDCK